MLENILKELRKIEHGFKHIEKAGNVILNQSDMDHLHIAQELLKDESYQGRMLGTFLLGHLSVTNSNAFELLKSEVANDSNWRVQEMLAKAIDYYCSQLGYESSLPVINALLIAENPNLNRAIVEGLRIWTTRPYFNKHPQIAIGMIAVLKDHKSEYVRKSVGNALRDISKKHKDLVETEIHKWDSSNKNIAFTKRLINQ